MTNPVDQTQPSDKAAVEAKFENALATFIASTKSSQESARVCSEMALAHFAEHGNTIWLQRFHDAMPKNYTRRAAFLKWAAAFSPLAMVKGKLVKDTSEHAAEFNVEGAAKKPFWEFAPETEITEFSAEDIVAAMENLVKRFQGKKFHAHDARATAMLARVEGIVTATKAIKVVSNDAAPAATAPAQEPAPAQDEEVQRTGTNG